MNHRILPRNRLRRLLPLLGCTAALLPWGSPAQTGAFNIATGAGLEPVTQAPAATAATAAAAKPSTTTPGKAPTEITAQLETTFDEKAHVAVFTGSVVVKDPQFNLTCDKLTAYLKKSAEAHSDGAAAHPPAKPRKSPAGKNAKEASEPDSSPGGGLDHAIAEGNVLVTQDKKDEATGEITHCVGKGAKGYYDATTGDMRLTGWPQMQQGPNNQVATTEGTTMIMNRDGRLKTIGPSHSVIIDQSDANKDQKSGKGAKSGKAEARKP